MNPLTSKPWLLTVVVSWVLLGAPVPAVSAGDPSTAQEKHPNAPACPQECPECAKALNKALDFLSRDILKATPQPFVQEVAPFSLAGLAFMAGGSTLTEGKYAKSVRACVDGVYDMLRFSREDRTLIHWGAAFTALFLTEVYHRKPEDRIKKTLKEIVNILETGQEKDGGWAHGPKPQSEYRSLVATTEVVLWALMALDRAGFEVKDGVIAWGIEYLEKCTMENIPDKSYNHSVGYNIEQSVYKNNMYYEPSPARSAMALFLIRNRGLDATKAPYSKWSGYLKRDMKRTLHFSHGSFHLCFLYTAMGSYRMGGDMWTGFRREWLGRLLETQNGSGASRIFPDTGKDLSDSARGHNVEDGGSTTGNPSIDDTYRTAILAVILQLPQENLWVMTGKDKSGGQK